MGYFGVGTYGLAPRRSSAPAIRSELRLPRRVGGRLPRERAHVRVRTVQRRRTRRHRHLRRKEPGSATRASRHDTKAEPRQVRGQVSVPMSSQLTSEREREAVLSPPSPRSFATRRSRPLPRTSGASSSAFSPRASQCWQACSRSQHRDRSVRDRRDRHRADGRRVGPVDQARPAPAPEAGPGTLHILGSSRSRQAEPAQLRRLTGHTASTPASPAAPRRTSTSSSASPPTCFGTRSTATSGSPTSAWPAAVCCGKLQRPARSQYLAGGSGFGLGDVGTYLSTDATKASSACSASASSRAAGHTSATTRTGH